MAEYTFLIDGMHCGSCVRRVTQALNATDGVEVKEVRIGAARILAADDAAPIDNAIASLAAAGFKARLEP